MSKNEEGITASRKSDHIDLAFASQIDTLDNRFYYEPMLAGHPDQELAPISFAGKTMKVPMWVSSMTGGTGKARIINHNLGKLCGELGMGMGLGSCRILLEEMETYFEDFNLRPMIGPDYPFFANMGVAQVEELIKAKELHRLEALVSKLEADGLILHVNPLQELLQPEGDRYYMSPIDIVDELLDQCSFKVIVKEVGQGFGPESLRELMKRPIAAIDFAAHGGTNFSQLELLRGDDMRKETYGPFTFVGHSASDMVVLANQVIDELGAVARCKEFIISGGVKNFLDGYYLTEKLNANAVYGQASPFLKHAIKSYDELLKFAEGQKEGFRIAKSLLKVRT